MKKKLLNLISVIAIVIMSFQQVSPQTINPLEPITFEQGTVEYNWDVWGNAGDTGAFTVVDNPDASGVNLSAKAGRYICHEGANSWAGMNIHDSVEITITDANKFFTMDVYKPQIRKVVMVLEQGNGVVTRFDAYPYNTKTDEWETMVFDFSSVVGVTFYRLTIQPDLTEEDPRTDSAVVYLDNILSYRDDPRMANPLRTITFEPEGSSYHWITFDNTTDNNDAESFTIVDNPDPTGVNTSSKVGKYITHDGAAMWAGVKTNDLKPIVITDNNKWLSMDVYKTSTNNVGLKYEGGTGGNQKDAFVTPERTGVWETLVFDFSTVAGDTFPTFVIFPDWATTNPREDEAITYIDNIKWSKDEPHVIHTLKPISFEEGTADYNWDVWGNNGDTAAFTVVDNPNKSWINSSNKVGKYVCHVGANNWAGMNIHDSVDITITEDNQYFMMSVLKTEISKVAMVFEQGSGTVTRFDSYPYNTKTDEWETLVFDFSSVMGKTFYRLTIQPDLIDVDPRTDSSVIYLDNITWSKSTPKIIQALEPISFEEETVEYQWDTWGNLEDTASFTVVDNPDKSGINLSEKVGQYICHKGSNNWAGMNIHDSVAIVISNINKFFTMDVYKPNINKVVMILEQGNGEVTRFDSYPYNTKTDEWETMVFDFSSAVGNTFFRLSIQPDLTEEDPRADSTIVYLDNIKWYEENPLDIVSNPGTTKINIYPNPANTILNITGINDATSIEIFSISGKMIKAMNVNHQDTFSIALDMLNEGVYFVRVISNKGLNTFKLIKQ